MRWQYGHSVTSSPWERSWNWLGWSFTRQTEGTLPLSRSTASPLKRFLAASYAARCSSVSSAAVASRSRESATISARMLFEPSSSEACVAARSDSMRSSVRRAFRSARSRRSSRSRAGPSANSHFSILLASEVSWRS